jgi:hypothetical protein
VALDPKGILHLKIERAAVRGIPFDQLYLVPEAQTPKMLYVFPSYLVTKLNKSLWSRVLDVPVEYTSREVGGRHTKSAESPARTLRELGAEGGWGNFWEGRDVIVPAVVGSNPAGPGSGLLYLTAKGWDRSIVSSQGGPFARKLDPSKTYLMIHGEKIDPVCAACPRLNNMILGECQLGTSICLQNLSIVNRSVYLQRLSEHNGVIPTPKESA